ncbi:hypothetical protein RH08_03895 [Candidatus Liberibacter asiaticus]|uniref:Uncharacterized protein n=2 Tax=Liberibacter asiaticus TaxID=34021 RepID=C6XG58_LIBAP|nr:hypothetical protein CLIBASIA_03925 [Candidatus Liberibacter asiaticus str. psy62]AGH17122.1 hypothetical protein WSI_03760 [Candidatus Liberibacter asiaticus str. gxpsy]ALK07799.1 hypothetical protein CD16_03855 [Candidatus Liberibacter asiaticus]BAP26648.1 hypothetical protein CGUJ_03925 [Candidatus Liberibacter asiaticus str. Ishi-1]ASK53274.1 hypothetical protein B2I23_03905 [Candidatus Liberibacter asiaticus]
MRIRPIHAMDMGRTVVKMSKSGVISEKTGLMSAVIIEPPHIINIIKIMNIIMIKSARLGLNLFF